MYKRQMVDHFVTVHVPSALRQLAPRSVQQAASPTTSKAAAIDRFAER
jgi:hypothetical protein